MHNLQVTVAKYAVAEPSSIETANAFKAIGIAAIVLITVTSSAARFILG